jgi:hypothetical protein
VFEPVPHFRAFLEYNVLRNDLQHLVDIVGSVVSFHECTLYWVLEGAVHSVLGTGGYKRWSPLLPLMSLML